MYNVIDYEETADKLHKELAKIYITDRLKHHNVDKWGDLTISDRATLVDFTFSLEDSCNMNLNTLCNYVMKYKKDILANKLDKSKFSKILAKQAN